ncbi:MAG: (Na+)-NQR maturation NqrM [Vibrionaceae bacterium]
MVTFVITFGVFLLVIFGMAIGFIVHRKKLTGSCGGLGAVGIEKECNCPTPCEARKKREAQAAQAEKEQAWQKDRIE